MYETRSKPRKKSTVYTERELLAEGLTFAWLSSGIDCKAGQIFRKRIGHLCLVPKAITKYSVSLFFSLNLKKHADTIFTEFAENHTTEAALFHSITKSQQPFNFSGPIRSFRLLRRSCTQTWLRVILDFPVLAEGHKRSLSFYQGILCEFNSSNWNFRTYGLAQVELATVHDHVSNVTIGRMRMQFWRDAIKDIFNVCFLFLVFSVLCNNLLFGRAGHRVIPLHLHSLTQHNEPTFSHTISNVL